MYKIIWIKTAMIATTILFMSHQAFASPSGDQNWQRAFALAKAFNNSLVECPDRVWPNMNWKNPQILMVDPNTQEALLWNEYGGSDFLKYVDFGSLPPNLTSGLFGFGQWLGQDLVSISLPFSKMISVGPFYRDFGLPLAIHEGFHFTVQTQWAPLPEGSRAVEYPAAWESRYFRFKILKSLLEAYLNPEKRNENLSFATYWNDSFVREYPEHYQSLLATDVHEGSAKYMDAIGSIIGWGGCQITEAEISLQLRRVFQSDELFDIENPEGLLFQGDSYILGLLAGAMLREIDPNDYSWHHRVTQGERPVELALNQSPAKTPPPDPAGESLVRNTVNDFNQRIAPLIDPLIYGLNDRGTLKISVPRSWLLGSFGAKGFVSPLSTPNTMAILAMQAQLLSGDRMSSVNFSGHTTAEIFEGNPCQSEEAEQLVFVIPPNGLTVTEMSYSIESEGVSATGPVSHLQARNENGHPWYCLED